MSQVLNVSAKASAGGCSDCVGRSAADSRIGGVLILLAAVALGQAVQVDFGRIDPPNFYAIAWLAAALGLSVAAVWVRDGKTADPRVGGGTFRPLFSEKALGRIILAAVLFQTFSTLTGPFGYFLKDRSPARLMQFIGLTATLGLCAAGATLTNQRAASWSAGAMIATFLLLGVWQIHGSPRPFIDVYWVQQEASRALLSGHNPYTTPMPDIYKGDPKMVSAGASAGGKMKEGFPYVPVSLLMALPGYAIAGDVRYAQLAAIAIAAVVMAFGVRASKSKPRYEAVKERWASTSTLQDSFARGKNDDTTDEDKKRWAGKPTLNGSACVRDGSSSADFSARLGAGAAAVLLTTPKLSYVLECAWTEPFSVCLLALTLLAVRRNWRWAPAIAGLFVASKQYLVMDIPLILALLPRPWTMRESARWAALATTAALAASLPLAAWDWPAFLHDVSGAAGLQNMRRLDALSLVTWWHYQSGAWPADWTAPAAGVAAMALCLWRARRTPAGFAAAVATTQVALFAFSKHAFCNYYFLAIAAMAFAVGSARIHDPASGASSDSSLPDTSAAAGISKRKPSAPAPLPAEAA
jgi:hypothetical protein